MGYQTCGLAQCPFGGFLPSGVGADAEEIRAHSKYMSTPSEMSKSTAATARRATVRKPVRQKAVNTVESILKATGELLETHGYEALTTKAIAENSGVAIGSFYQYFPNKEAVVGELVDSYREQIRTYLLEAVARHSKIDVNWIGQLISDLANIYQQLPGFTGIWLGRYSTGPLAELAERLRFEIVDALNDAFGAAYPNIPHADRERCLVMAVETAKLLLHEQGPHRALIREELHRMLGLYLSALFEGK